MEVYVNKSFVVVARMSDTVCVIPAQTPFYARHCDPDNSLFYFSIDPFPGCRTYVITTELTVFRLNTTSSRVQLTEITELPLRIIMNPYGANGEQNAFFHSAIKPKLVGSIFNYQGTINTDCNIRELVLWPEVIGSITELQTEDIQ